MPTIESIYNWNKEHRANSYAKAIGLLKFGEKILDMGCGAGEFIEILRGKGFFAKGFDAREDKVKFCQEKGLPVALFDITKLPKPLSANTVDTVVALDVLEHLENPLQALINWRDWGNNLVMIVSCGCASCHDKYEEHLFQFSKEILQQQLDQAGWKVEGEIEEWRPDHPNQPPGLVVRATKI